MKNIYTLPTTKFLTQVLKQNELTKVMSLIDSHLSMKQSQTIRQNSLMYKNIALRAKQVSKKKIVHDLANELIRLVDIPVMSIEERKQGEKSTAV